MTSLDLLRPLFRYQAWANDDLLGKLDGLDAVRQAPELHSAIRLINHAYVVGRIFAAHLTGAQHGYAVVGGLAQNGFRCMAFSRRSATLEPDSRRAIRRNTIGARTSPTMAQSPSTPTVSR